MTTFLQIKTNLALDLRDEGNEAFSDAMLGSFITEGVAEVSLIYPKEAISEITPVASTYDYACPLQTVFRVELWRDSAFRSLVPENADDSSQGGWELFAGNLILPARHVDAVVPATDFWKVWGYSGRTRPVNDNDVMDLDEQGEWAVRYYARWRGFSAMAMERSLFKQWQAISQNTDITESQLLQMVALYAGEWDRRRNYLRRLRRI